MKQCPIIALPYKNLWEVYDDYVYVTNENVEIFVPKGFQTDLASVPLLLRWRYPKCHPKYATASILHDTILQLYTRFPREYADTIFKEVLENTSSKFTTSLFYLGVSTWTSIKKLFKG